MKLKIGQRIKTKIETRGYCPDHHTVVPIGTIGTIGAVKVARVRMTGDCKCQTFNCVDIQIGFRKVRASYHTHDLELA